MTERELVAYLLERGLVNSRSIVDGDVVVEPSSRRNRNFRVLNAGEHSYLVKQGVGAERAASIAREALLYESTNGCRRDRLRAYIPTLYEFDPEGSVLVLELLRDGESLLAYQSARRSFATTQARSLAAALSALHRPGGAVDRSSRSHPLMRKPVRPWVLSAHRPTLELFAVASSGSIDLTRTLQRFEAFGGHLDQLVREWRSEALVHGDVKWDNCLAVAAPGSSRKTRVKLVDWESVGVGDPAWDVGSVFSDYLGFWLLSIPVTGDSPPDRFLELARFPLAAMQPALAAFWNVYARRAGLRGATANAFLLRAVRYAAARLIQTAFERLQSATSVTGTALGTLQLSLNVLERPREASVHLLGIEPLEPTAA